LKIIVPCEIMAVYSRETTHYPDGTFKIKHIVSDLETDGENSKELNLVSSDSMINEIENKTNFREREHDYILDTSDSNITEGIFNQIDLSQARISKDRNDIQSLAEETDNLLNQLEHNTI